MNNKIIIPIMVVLAVFAGLTNWYFFGQNPLNFFQSKQPEKYTGPVEKITLGVEKSLSSSSVWVAENKGYFREQGLEALQAVKPEAVTIIH